jgi:phosphoribosylformylglycinamidine cyclo-ligase
MGSFALALTTDGVGSKVLVASAMRNWTTVGIDCVAMNVNDLFAIGAEPVAFVDYIAIEDPDKEILAQIAVGLEEGCRLANVTLVGGETATLPEIIRGFDLAGTAVGVVNKEKIITGEKIEIGDVIYGVPSSGIHSNGLTLARKIVDKAGLDYSEPFGNHTLGDELLKPTRIYLEILEVIKKVEVHGLAHITGSGLLKLKRLKNVGYNIYDPLKPHEIFNFLMDEGNVDIKEMYRTFNMGMGFAIILSENEVRDIKKIIDGRVVGEVVEEGISVEDVRID